MKRPPFIATRLIASACALTMLGSCAGKSKRDDPNASTAERVAEILEKTEDEDSKTAYQLPAFEDKTLPNGLRILFVPDNNLPYISYSLLIKSGSAQEPAEQAGVSTFVAELLDKGTAKRTATQLAQDIGQMAADFDASASEDYSLIGASALATQADPLLDTLVEMVTQPAFNKDEIERVRKQVQAWIERRVDNPEAFSSAAFEDFLFQGHPYARTATGDLKTVKGITKKHVTQHYLRHYRPNNAILAVVGKYTPEQAAKIEQAFSSWQQKDVPADQFGQIQPIQGVQIRLVDKPGLVQAQIRVGNPGIKRQNADFIPLRVANTILGGAFASRLNDRIRKDLGLTYNIGSYFDARQDTGPFEISTFTKNASVGQTLTETLKVLTDFKEKGVTNDEVKMAKGYLKGVFPQAIETKEKLAFNLMLLRFYGIPDTYLTNYLKDVDRLSASDVNKVIKKYVDDKNLKVLVYSSASEVLPQLQPLGNVEVKQASDFQ